MLLGAHVSIAGGMQNAFGNGQEIGCEAIQVFVKSPRSLRSKPLAEDQVTAWYEQRKGSAVKAVVTHANYLLNFATPKKDYWKTTIDAFLDEMDRCQRLGIPYLIFHPGSHLKTSDEEGIQRVADGLNKVLARADRFPDVTPCIENMAGQGTIICHRFEQIAAILAKLHQPDRVGVCLDTCHTFAGGYELRTADGYERTMHELDEIVGLEKVKAIHLNDSKQDLGSRVDRHEAIGKGKIGRKGFALLVNDKRWSRTPAILETPVKEEKEYAKELKVLRSLVGKKVKGELADF